MTLNVFMASHVSLTFRQGSPDFTLFLSGSQFVFNIGFYAVVPFLAIYLRDNLLLSGAIIGLIIGLRTFSQQGMFLVGGALAAALCVLSVLAVSESNLSGQRRQ